VTLEEEAYPVKLDKAMVSRAEGCGELNGSSHQSEVQHLVGRGLLECDPLSVKDHFGVTNVFCLTEVDTSGSHRGTRG